jgi:hypothetical protein
MPYRVAADVLKQVFPVDAGKDPDPTWTVRALSLFIRILIPSLFNALIISV